MITHKLSIHIINTLGFPIISELSILIYFLEPIFSNFKIREANAEWKCIPQDSPKASVVSFTSSEAPAVQVAELGIGVERKQVHTRLRSLDEHSLKIELKHNFLLGNTMFLNLKLIFGSQFQIFTLL